MLLSQNLFAQNRFSVKIKIPANLQGKRFTIDYDNGNRQINVSDSFINNEIQFEGNYISRYATLIIQYVTPDTSFSNQYFIGEKPAEFDFSSDSVNLDKNFFKNCITKNAIEIYATDWIKKRDIFSKDAINQMNVFWDKNAKNVWRVDSVTRRFYSNLSFVDKKDMEFIEKNNNEYTAFWWFKTTVVPGELSIYKNDPTAIQKLLTFMDKAFPDKFIKSPEGQNLQKTLKAKLLTTNKIAPAFKEKDLKGNNIDLKEYRGRFVLIDFWASWCIPCRQMAPHLKELYNKYHSKGLDIISVSVDTDSSSWKNAVKAEGINNWVNMLSKDNFDNGNDKIALHERYGVNAYPTIFLLDKKGMIIFRYEGGYDKNDPKSELDKKIEEIFK
jgi:thiol-disulfide isomerase/thioredoxin